MLKSYICSGLKIAQDSIFDLSELYKMIFKWFEVYGYGFYEKEYADIDEQSGKHLEIFWVAEKNVDAYVRYVVEISILILGMQKIEIEKEGLKFKTNKGSIEFQVTAYLAKDYDNKWSRSGFHQQLRNIYDKLIIHGRLGALWGELKGETDLLIDEIKAFLNLHKY